MQLRDELDGFSNVGHMSTRVSKRSYPPVDSSLVLADKFVVVAAVANETVG